MVTFGEKLKQIREISSGTTDLGERFEYLFMKLALTEPEFGIQNIWRWKDWPQREELTGLGPKDIGIDLVAQSITNDHIAIQCKCYGDDQKIGKSDLNSFFSFSQVYDVSVDTLHKVFDTQWVVSTCDWTSTADEFVKAQGKRLKRVDFSEYAANEFIEHDASKRRTREPYQFQKDAIKNCVDALYYAGHSRGRLVMACGTGKTFVALNVAEKVAELSKNKLILFLAPSIALVSQARREWLMFTQGLLPLVVCSDRTAGGKDEDISLSELKCKVTTDPREISNFAKIRNDSLKVIFCTYQSLQKVVDAQMFHGMPKIGLTVADEAHRTTGVMTKSTGVYRATIGDAKKVNFQLMHDSKLLESSRRMYMTATPRVYDEHSTKLIEKKGYKVVDMGGENADTYGVEMYRIGFGEAVSYNRLSEYRVIVLGVSRGDVTPNLRKHIEDIVWEGKQGSIRPTIGELVRVLGTSLAINGVYEFEHSRDTAEPLRKVLAFSNSIARSKWYTNVLELGAVKRATTSRMSSGSALKMKAQHIDASASAKVRYEVLQELENAHRKQETYLVSNVKLFTEGVDVPSLDAVVFLDPRDSQVDVVQAVGRVMRRAPHKKYGYIIVPIVLDDHGDWLAALERSSDGYGTIGRVLRALQAHDSRLAEEPEKLVYVYDARKKKGKNSNGKGNQGGEKQRELELGLYESLRKVDQQIYAKVVATSRLGRPGQMVADQITSAVKYASSILQRSECVGILADKLDISLSSKNFKKDSESVATIAALLLCNACLMHKRLKSTVPEMGMLVALDKINISSEPIGQLSDIWSTILEKDYTAIFAPALAILQGLREHGFTNHQTHSAIRPLIECANQVADSLSELGYDHAGPLYHQILPSAQSDGAYYTNNLSALMLARLTFDQNYIDWTNIEAVNQLRIMDPACGTGTLLMAVCKTLKDRVKANVPEINVTNFHKTIVENMLCGLDINHHAVQLAGCNLTLGAPTVDYDRINVARVHHGTRNPKSGLMQVGSLELLDMNRSDFELDNVTHQFSSIDELGAESTGGGKVNFPHENLDVVIMNPPFTSNAKRGAKFSEDIRNEMRFREQNIRDVVQHTDHLAAQSIDLNSIQTFFPPLADRILGESGTLSEVLPTTVITSTSAKSQRELLHKRFNVQYVITSHDPRRPNFSENTTITESLLICRRKNGVSKDKTRFVNLRRLPMSPSEAIECSDAIEAGNLGDWGSQIYWDYEKLAKDDWLACLFTSSYLAGLASELTEENPSGRTIRGVLQSAGNLAYIEPAGQAIRGTFVVDSEFQSSRNERAIQAEKDGIGGSNRYLALWNHKSKLRSTLSAEPDSIIVPRKGKYGSAGSLWHKKGRLLIVTRVDTMNVRTTSVLLTTPALGSAWIPISPFSTDERILPAWCIWLNSSWSIVQFLAMRSRKLTYPSFSLDQLRSVKLPVPGSIDLDLLASQYNHLKDETLRPWSEINTDSVRKQIDEACANAMDFDPCEAEEVRNAIAIEPTVAGN